MSISDVIQTLYQPWFEGGIYIVDRDSHAAKGIQQLDYVDQLCAAYMSDSIDLNKLIPFQNTGDGNCLLHALCTAVNGKDQNYMELRESMTKELVENELWYRYQLPPAHDWNNSLELARSDGLYLGSEHIWALANHLRRPIVLLDSLVSRQKYGEGEVRIFSSNLMLPCLWCPLLCVNLVLVVQEA